VPCRNRLRKRGSRRKSPPTRKGGAKKKVRKESKDHDGKMTKTSDEIGKGKLTEPPIHERGGREFKKRGTDNFKGGKAKEGWKQPPALNRVEWRK